MNVGSHLRRWKRSSRVWDSPLVVSVDRVAAGGRYGAVREIGPRDRADQLKEDVSGVSNYSSDVADT